MIASPLLRRELLDRRNDWMPALLTSTSIRSAHARLTMDPAAGLIQIKELVHCAATHRPFRLSPHVQSPGPCIRGVATTEVDDGAHATLEKRCPADRRDSRAGGRNGDHA